MSRRARLFVILGFLILLVVIAVFAVRQTLARGVTMNDPSEVGNTAGNIHNGGYFCEKNGVVYFSNPADGGALYAMNPNETSLRKISSMSVRNIMSGGRFLYVYMDGSARSVTQGIGSVVSEYGIYRMRNDGRYTVCLLKELAGSMQLGGSYIYYEQGDDVTGVLNRIRIDKKDRTGYGNTPAFYNEHIDPAAYSNGVIYYSSAASGHTLYGLSVEREPLQPQPLFSENISQPIVQGSFVYFLNAADGYKICRYNVATGMTETLTTVGADCYNLNDTYIFFDSQTADVPGLYRVGTNGFGEELLLAGAYNALHLTSNYLYYRMFGAEDMFYHIPLTGPAIPGIFNPGTVAD